MSRRKQPNARPHVTYGQIIMECPHGHPLGAIIYTLSGALRRLDRPLGDNSSKAQPVVVGEKIKALCPACREAGRLPDYQASWETVAALLTAERDDTRSEHCVLKLS